MRQAYIRLSPPYTTRPMHVSRGKKSGTIVEFSSQAVHYLTKSSSVYLPSPLLSRSFVGVTTRSSARLWSLIRPRNRWSCIRLSSHLCPVALEA